MSYRDELTIAMDGLASDERVRFIGYGLLTGRAGGTLRNVRPEQIIETPVAENLMVGLAIGMSLRGLLPVVYIERCDFILNAMDAIVNHLDKIETISRGEFCPTAILRVVVGNRNKPLYTGATHTQDFSAELRSIVKFPVKCLPTEDVIRGTYRTAHNELSRHSTAVFEYKDLI